MAEENNINQNDTPLTFDERMINFYKIISDVILR